MMLRSIQNKKENYNIIEELIHVLDVYTNNKASLKDYQKALELMEKLKNEKKRKKQR